MPVSSIKPIIVIAEDKRDSLDLLGKSMVKVGFDVRLCQTSTEANSEIDSLIGTGRLVGVIADLGLDGGEKLTGWAVVKHAYSASAALDLIVYTAFPSDIPLKPGEKSPSFTLIEKGGPDSEAALDAQIRLIRDKWDRAHALVHDEATRKLYTELAPAYAKSSLPVLILGETGTGKESLAREISDKSHQAGHLLAINCGALEPSLAFSELFGYSKGAFTGAAGHVLGKILEASGYKRSAKQSNNFEEWLRDGNPDLSEVNGMLDSDEARVRSGTLFLDELAALPPSVMPGLLRVMETKDVSPFGYHGFPIRAHCRVVSATNEVSALKDIGFRKDLLYRLGGAVLTLPPLHERQPSVISDYVNDAVWSQLGIPKMIMSPAAIQHILELYRDRADETARVYQAGNFRSLRNLVHRAALLATADRSVAIDAIHIDAAISDGEILAQAQEGPDEKKHIREVFRNALRERLVGALRQDFGLDDLKELSGASPVETAYAFLRCNLVPRMRGSRKTKYYELREIEIALATGYGRGSWINSSLKVEHVAQAAHKFFGLALEEAQGARILEIVKLIQRRAVSETYE